jgi:L-ascorbate metabolism protein UlaG (beta-lactamase superfamily)
VRLTWLGHSTVLVEVAGVRVLADPVLRGRIGPLRRAAAPADVSGPVDAVLVSHLHHDHCDLPTLRRLAAPVVVVPPGAGSWLRRHGITGVTELPIGATLALTAAPPGDPTPPPAGGTPASGGPGGGAPVGGVAVTAVAARHDGRREPFGPRAAAVGHVVDSPAGAVWLAGDTGLFPGMAQLAATTRQGRLDAAAVPVWGWGPNLGPGHLDPRAAAEAAMLARVRHAVPVHWGTLHPLGLRRSMRHLLRTPGPEFARHLAGTDVAAHVLPIGGRLDL